MNLIQILVFRDLFDIITCLLILTIRHIQERAGTRSKANAAKPFQEIDPWSSEDSTLSRRNLPHLEVSGATYFVTFRSKAVLPPDARDLVMAEIRAHGGKRIDLDAAVVMPDPVHLIFRLLDDEELCGVLKLIKGRTARYVNQLLMRYGKLWTEESFDHAIRHAVELEEKLEYVRQNPVRKRLALQPENYKWLFLKKRGHTG